MRSPAARPARRTGTQLPTSPPAGTTIAPALSSDEDEALSCPLSAVPFEALTTIGAEDAGAEEEDAVEGSPLEDWLLAAFPLAPAVSEAPRVSTLRAASCWFCSAQAMISARIADPRRAQQKQQPVLFMDMKPAPFNAVSAFLVCHLR